MAKKHRTTEERLEHLYSKCASVPCEDGCAACCGPVAFSQSEWAKTGLPVASAVSMQEMQGALVAIKAVMHDGERVMCCLFKVDGGGCGIYDDRPFICRLYGCTEMLPCAKGLKSDLQLTTAQTVDLMARYQRIVLEESLTSTEMPPRTLPPIRALVGEPTPERSGGFRPKRDDE